MKLDHLKKVQKHILRQQDIVIVVSNVNNMIKSDGIKSTYMVLYKATKITMISVYPVSYTHLDVYKRQTISYFNYHL